MKQRGVTNPNGANQYKLDPRQSLFIAYYLDPKSQSFGRATKSAVLAGYEHEYAENIMSKMPTWLSEKMEEYRNSEMLEKAERNINELLDLPTMTPAMGAFGPIFEKKVVVKKVTLKNGKVKDRKVVTKVPVLSYATGLIKVKNDISQFVAETVGRKTYSKAKVEPPPPLASILNMTQIIINLPQKA